MSRVPVALAAAIAIAIALAAAAGAFRLGRAPLPVAGNPADHLVGFAPDPEDYDPATHCTSKPKPGMTGFVGWLRRHADGVFWGTYRCERWGPHEASLHAEGRAVDWHLDVANAADRHAARRLIELFLAPDSAGTPHALARRMGVEEIIWDCSYWAAGMRLLRLPAVLQQARRAAQARRPDDGAPQPHPLRALQGGRHAAHVVLAARLSAEPARLRAQQSR
jgi:hypothetical protein